MPIFSVVLLLISVWFFWKAYKFMRDAIRRWKGGMFRFSFFPAAMAVICLGMGSFLVFGASVEYEINDDYRRAGAADVEYLGNRPGFPNPLVAYTDRETERTCVAEVVGGEEYLNELVCLDPQEPRD